VSVLVSGLSQVSELVLIDDSDGQAFTAGITGVGLNITCVLVDANSVTYVLAHFVLCIAFD
jgi:F420-0:gamma-glutamyl ligase